MSEAPILDYGIVSSCNRFAEWVENAVSGADYLRDQLSTVDDLARLLVVVRNAQRLLGMLERQTEADLATAVRAHEDREPQVPGVGVLKLHYRKRTEWDSSRLLATVANRAAATDDPEAAVLELFSATLRISPTTPWKSTGLQELGLDPAEFRSTEITGTSVRITEPDT